MNVMLDLDEMLALMAAPIYASRMAVAFASGTQAMPAEWDKYRMDAMYFSIEDAKVLWVIVRTNKQRSAQP